MVLAALPFVLPGYQINYVNNIALYIIIAVGFFLFNAVGLPTYPSLYDKFLLAVSLGFNIMTVWTAWKWL